MVGSGVWLEFVASLGTSVPHSCRAWKGSQRGRWQSRPRILEYEARERRPKVRESYLTAREELGSEPMQAGSLEGTERPKHQRLREAPREALRGC